MSLILSIVLLHAWWLAKDNIEQAQVAYKAFHDAKHTGPEYKESDIVYIRTPHRDSDLSNKFATRFSGHYVVVETQGPVVNCKKVKIGRASCRERV